MMMTDEICEMLDNSKYKDIKNVQTFTYILSDWGVSF